MTRQKTCDLVKTVEQGKSKGVETDGGLAIGPTERVDPEDR